VRRQALARQPERKGIRMDVESGDVWVDDVLLPPLTDLEYRLMLLLYGNLDKICDKYRIVESVWGESYIDQVDDARIEKLISRLRQKLGEDSSDPRFLTTVRGRGYKLTSPDIG
jgi:DNA-binding response OmpR family regulator